MEWAAKQEQLGKGTWLDSKHTYQEILDNRYEIAKETLTEITVAGQSCDSGGCTD
jgi:hypothetical protein